MSIHFCNNLAFSQCFPLVFIVSAVDFAIYPLSRSIKADLDIHLYTFRLRKTANCFRAANPMCFTARLLQKQSVNRLIGGDLQLRYPIIVD